MKIGRIHVLVLSVAVLCRSELLNAQEIPRDPAETVKPLVANRRLPRDLVDIGQRPAKTVNPLVADRNMINVDGRWATLPEGMLADEVVNDEGKPIWQARISDAGFDLSVIGGVLNAHAAAARQALDAILQQDVEVYSERYRLTAVQSQKLHLAGRGDIKSLFDRIEESRRRFHSYVVHDLAGLTELRQEFSRESNDLKSKLRIGPFGKGSLFAKTLKGVLTTDQIDDFEKWMRNRAAVVTTSWDLKVR